MYYNLSENLNRVIELLTKHIGNWDFIMVISEALLFINTQLPIIRVKDTPVILDRDLCLLKSILFVSLLLPYPPVVNASQFFINHIFGILSS